MEHWDLSTLDVAPHQPQILQSARGEGRAIALHLPAGEQLQDHEVHERAYLTVVDGEVEVDAGETVTAGPGALFVFDPKERHEVRAISDARLLLVLAPWPGAGTRAAALSAHLLEGGRGAVAARNGQNRPPGGFFYGSDGTRTRDLRRDRPAL